MGMGMSIPIQMKKIFLQTIKTNFRPMNPLVQPAVIEEFQDVIASNESLPIKSDTGTASPPTSGEKVPETISEEKGINIDQLPSQLSEIESETDSTQREFKSLARRLSLELKPLEKERQEEDVKIIPFEPETEKASAARPADDSKARKDVQLAQSGATMLKPLEKERQEADIKTVRLEPETEKVSVKQPARDSKQRRTSNPPSQKQIS